MKRLLFLCALGFAACSSPQEKETSSDTTAATKNQTQERIQTDSGSIVYTLVDGHRDGLAEFYDRNGKLKQSGLYANDVQSGTWKKFDTEGKVIEANHYSEGKVLFQLDKDDFDFVELKDTALGIKINVPRKWKVLPSPNPKIMMSFAKEVDTTQIKLAPNINIVKAKLQAGEDLDKLADMELNMLHQQVGRVDVVHDEHVLIDSSSAFERYGMYQTDEFRVGFLDVIIISGDEAWFISCATQNNVQGEFLRYQSVFEAIAESFVRLH